MNLRHLEYLRLVVEQGSFAAAARVAGVSQPAVSQGLRQLQAELGAPLLVRQGRRSVPTPFARRLASEASGLAERAASLGAAPAPAPTHVLRAGVTSTAAVICGPVLHDAWCAGRPRRTLRLVGGDEGSLLRALQRHELDLVVAARPRGELPHGVTGEPLYQLQPQVHARRGHPAHAITSLAELRGLAWARVEPHVRGPVRKLPCQADS
ncbi:MAG: LysR family transcriptional regulator [Burkholderiales bacterium]|nr:LysR family transcriptional regulator [Burkholderiales bacterium]